MTKRYSPEFKERAIRMVEDHQRVHACSKWRAAEAVASKLGASSHTVYGWLKRTRQVNDQSSTSDDEPTEAQKRIAALEAEVLELRRANEILKSASAFFAKELDRPTTR